MSLVIRVMITPGLLGREEVERQPLQVGEDLDPQVVHDPGRQPAGHLHLPPLAQRPDRRAHQVGQRGAHTTTQKWKCLCRVGIIPSL